MCDAWFKFKPNDSFPSPGYYKKAFNEIKEWLGKDIMISFAGGEPFLNPQTVELIRIAGSFGFFTSVVTNGTILTPEIIENIIDSRLSSISFSIDSLEPNVHDYMRGIEGTFKKAMNNLIAVQKLKIVKHSEICVNICTIINNSNYNTLIDICKFGKSIGLSGILFQAINDSFFYRENLDANIWPTTAEQIEQICNAIDKLIALKNDPEFKRVIINSPKLLEDMKSYFRSMPWMKDGRIEFNLHNIDNYLKKMGWDKNGRTNL
jgi:MoaA/NifB/PqqE/SkfB family radical SAM enzyme